MSGNETASGPSQEHEVVDPATSGARLAQIASERPDLGEAVAMHPNAYAGLLDWLSQYGTPGAKGAVARRQNPESTAPPPPLPPIPAAPPVPPSGARRPAASVPPPGEASRPTPSTRKPRKGMLVGLVAGGAVATLAIVGGAVWFTSTFGAAASPEAAAERAIRAAANLDPVGLFTSLAPSEVSSLREALESAGSIRDTESDTDYMELLRELERSTEVTLDNLAFETETVTDGVEIVYVVDGMITIDGDPATIASALLGLGTQGTSAILSASGTDQTEISRQLADAEATISAQLEEQLPISWNISEMVAESRLQRPAITSPISIVTVDEGGWYVSPLLTTAETWFSQFAYSDLGMRDIRGTSVPEALMFDSPEAAAAGAADAFTTFIRFGELESLASALPLPERRLLALYGGAYVDVDYWRSTNTGSATVESLKVRATETGDSAMIEIDDLTLALGLPQQSVNIQMAGTCVRWYTISAAYPSSSGDGAGCLSDWPQSRALGLQDASIVAVKENGGWLISPLATFTGMVSTATESVAELAASDRLDEIWLGR